MNQTLQRLPINRHPIKITLPRKVYDCQYNEVLDHREEQTVNTSPTLWTEMILVKRESFVEWSHAAKSSLLLIIPCAPIQFALPIHDQDGVKRNLTSCFLLD